MKLKSLLCSDGLNNHSFYVSVNVTVKCSTFIRFHSSKVLSIFILYLKVDEKKNKRLVYPEHLPLTKIQAGLKSGKFLQVHNITSGV